jgi:hypothetical protein
MTSGNRRVGAGQRRDGKVSMRVATGLLIPVSTAQRMLRGVVLGGALASTVLAQTAGGSQKSNAAPAVVSTQPVHKAGVTEYHATALTARARQHYQLFWGVDALEVKAVESGEMIRFSYYVVDAAKAAPLSDKKEMPKLIDPEARVSLTVPSVDQVGQLRQSASPTGGRAYWMVFSNKRREVKPGDRVSIVIGKFRADGLYVQ